LSGAIRFAALDEPCRHLDPEHVEALNVVLARRTSGGMHLAVGDGRGILESGLFQQELGAEVAHGPLPVRASVPTGQALRLEIPTPFLLSWTGRTATRQRLELERGALVVVRGPNGSGKTSLLEALARAAAKARARYGFSRQEPEHQVFATTPERELHDIAAVHDAAPWCAGGPVFGRLIDNLALEPWSTQPTPRLPLGVLSLFGVAIALWMGHDLVLLDEPTQGLDVRAARVLASELVRCAKEGARVVVASHDPELARVANREWLINDGELTDSLPRFGHRGEPER
jgi:ATPase subunit of ABC transporter with duplicated ATPase domains